MESLPAVRDGKTIAIISYLTIIGTIVALVLNNSKKNPFVSFHVRQMIGLNALYFINQWIIYSYFGWIAFSIVGLITLALWVIGMIGVTKGEETLVPVIGEHFQEWFKSI